MRETVQEILSWGYPMAIVIAIALAATRKEFPGKPWLVACLSIELTIMLVWRVQALLVVNDVIDYDTSWFYDVWALPLPAIGVADSFLLVPFIFAVASSPSHSRLAPGTETGTQGKAPPAEDTASPFNGVHGWLRFFVVVNLYISPVLFRIQQIMGFIGGGMLAEEYPGGVSIHYVRRQRFWTINKGLCSKLVSPHG